jgi:hypothetical protein
MVMRQILVVMAAALLSVRPASAQLTNSIPPGRFPAGLSVPANVTMPATDPTGPGVVATVPLTVTQSHDMSNTSPKENLAAFDPTQTEIRWINNRWQLLAGGVFIKEFGANEGDAREALRVIRDLHLSQRGTVGQPQPVMEYWLADGQPPQTAVAGLRLLPLDLNSLRVDSAQGQWYLRDANRVYFVFGSHGEEANQALDVIRRHGFNRVGYVGQPIPSLVYFLGTPQGPTQAPTSAQPFSPSPNGFPGNPGQPPQLGGIPSTSPLGPNPIGLPASVMAGNAFAGHQPGDFNSQVGDQLHQSDKVTFDPRQVQVRRDNQDWKLYYGPYMVANFGPNPMDARQALNILQSYHCNEQCLIGPPRQPTFSYFLSNGQAPRGTVYGMGGWEFRPEALALRQVGNEWVVCDGNQALIRFGDRVDDAKQMLQVIRQQQFDYIAHIGHGEAPGLNILVRTH